MENKKKEAPFQIKIPKDKQKQMAKDLENVENLKSAIHFIKNYKKYIIVNKKFKRKMVNFSIKTVAGISSIVLAITLINNMNKKDETKEDIKPIETTIEEINNDPIGPVLSPASLEVTSIEYTEPTKEDNVEILEEMNETITPSTTISFPMASSTNESSDYDNYYKVKDKYGAYIDEMSKKYGIDSRLIIDIIAQENPNGKDLTSLGTYGPTCITTSFRGESITYGYYDNGEWIKESSTIDYEKLKPSNNGIYKDGIYGNITNAEAEGIEWTYRILQNNYGHLYNACGDKFTPEEYYVLTLYSYNFGYPGAIGIMKQSDNFYDATYNFKYNNSIPFAVDKEYGLNVLNKEQEFLEPYTFTDYNGNSISFNLEKNNDLAAFESKEIINKKSI